MVKGGVTSTYAYDPLGRRRSKTVGGTVTNFMYEGTSELAELSATGSRLRFYLNAAQVDDRAGFYDDQTGTGWSFYHTNHQGTVLYTTKQSASGAIGDKYAYDAYGLQASTAVLTGNPFRYTGRYLDAESGLYYYRARYYSPALGRFLQTDPIGAKDDLNLYTYVKNDPLNKTDPTGETCTQKQGGTYDCHVDKFYNWRGKEISRDQLTKGQASRVAAFEAAYTSAVNKLMSNPSKTANISIAATGKSMSVNAGALGNALINRNMEVNGRVFGGERVNGMGTRGNTTFVGPAGRSGEGQVAGVTATNRQQLQEIEVAHEGLHGSTMNIDKTLRDTLPFNRWNGVEHQAPYNQAVEDLLAP